MGAYPARSPNITHHLLSWSGSQNWLDVTSSQALVAHLPSAFAISLSSNPTGSHTLLSFLS